MSKRLLFGFFFYQKAVTNPYVAFLKFLPCLVTNIFPLIYLWLSINILISYLCIFDIQNLQVYRKALSCLRE